MLCIGIDAALWISQYNAAWTELCVEDNVFTLEAPFSKRAFANLADITALAVTQAGHLPAAGRIINAIGTGALRFEYFTWFRVAGTPGTQISLEGKLRSPFKALEFAITKKAANLLRIPQCLIHWAET